MNACDSASCNVVRSGHQNDRSTKRSSRRRTVAGDPSFLHASHRMPLNHHLFSAILRTLEDAIVAMSPDGTITHWNLAAERLLGYSALDAVGMHGRQILPSIWWQYWHERLAELRNGSAVTCNTVRQHKNGTAIDLHATSAGIFDERGHFLGYFNIFKDLKKQNDQHAADMFLAAIVRSSPDAILSTDVLLNVRSWNKAAEALFGYSSDEAIGIDIKTFLPDIEFRIRGPDVASVPESQHRFEIDISARDGKPKCVNGVASPLTNTAGIPTGWSVSLTDITERKRLEAMDQEYRQRKFAEDALREEKLKLDMALKNMPHGLSMFSGEQRLVLSNARHAELYRLPPELLKPGTPLSELIAHRVQNGVLKCETNDAAITDTLVGFLDIQMDKSTCGIHEFADGRLISVTRQPMQGGGWVAIHEDVTEREQTRQRLESLDRAKSEFLATVSHEIRTPMTGMIGMMGLLVDTPLSERQRDLVQTALDCGDVLVSIVNDVLDFSKIEAGALEIEAVEFNLPVVIDSSVALLEQAAAEKGVSLNCVLSAGVPSQVYGDPVRVRQILTNLVSNAVKFTERGSVRVGCSHRMLDNRSVELRFEIQDTGIGIANDVRGKLFNRFAQADTSTARLYGGTGLGLAICKNLAELMGGQIGCDSTLGLGSTFWFTIRCKREQPPVSVEVVRHANPGMGPSVPRRVLVAEDNPVNQLLLSSILRQAGHSIDLVGNGKEALEAVQSGSYDVVLMDILMPVMDGVTATRSIRQLDGPERHIPIIAVTANLVNGDREEYIRSGMTDCVAKPLNVAALLKAIADATGDQRAAGSGELSTIGASSRPFVSASACSSVAPVPCVPNDSGHPAGQPSSGTVIELKGLDPVFDEAFLTGLQKNLHEADLREAFAGVPAEAAKAVNLIKVAIAAGDVAAARNAAHTLTGMASNFGAVRLAAIGRRISRTSSDIEAVARDVAPLERALEETRAQIKLIA